MNPDEEWEEWRTWLGSPTGKTIKAQVIEMLAFRQIWDTFVSVQGSAPEAARKDGTFFEWVRFSYTRSQALAVRRMADKRSDVVSLARLLDSIWRYPTVLSRKRVLAMRSEDNREGIAEDHYNSLAGTGDFIDPRIPAEDYEALQRKTKRVRDWVNTSVAHLSSKGKPLGPSRLPAIHTAVDDIADLFGKYHSLIRGEIFVPVVVFEPWPVVFRVSWIEDDEHFHRVQERMHEVERAVLRSPQSPPERPPA